MSFYAKGFGASYQNGASQETYADNDNRPVDKSISEVVARQVIEQLEKSGFVRPDLDDRFSLWLHEVKTGWRPVHLAPADKMVLLRLNPKAREQFGYSVTIGTFNAAENCWWCPGIGRYSAGPTHWLPLPPWFG